MYTEVGSEEVEVFIKLVVASSYECDGWGLVHDVIGFEVKSVLRLFDVDADGFSWIALA